MYNAANMARLIRWLAATILASGAAVWAQTVGLNAVPTGLKPLGVDITAFDVTTSGETTTQYDAVVANSGDNSVSILGLKGGTVTPTVTPLTTLTGIPSPYAIASCGGHGALMLITSPSDKSVRVLQLPDGGVVGKLQTGSQPYSAACFYDQTGTQKGVVSNLGDNNLVVFDLATLSIITTIPGVPGSRGFHGIAVSGNSTGSLVAWVAGTDANVVTVVNLLSARVLTQIPVSRPTAVFASSRGGTSVQMYVASAGSDSVIAYDRDTVQLISTIQNVPNAQDFLFSGQLGRFATIGGQDSLWEQDATGAVSIIPGVPGAAALAATNFGFLPAAPTWVALVTSTNSNSVFLIGPQPSNPLQFIIANGASFVIFQVAAGSVASAFASTGVSQPLFVSALPLPYTLGGVTLSLGGTVNFNITSGWIYSPTGSVRAPLSFVGPSQVNFQIPPGTSLGNSVPAQLTRPDGSTLLTTLNVVATSPGIFTILQNGQGQGAVLNQDYSLSGNPQSIVGAKPAPRGGVIQIFATGAGATTPPMLPGEAAPASGNPLVFTQVQPVVTIGGITSPQVYYSIMAPGYPGVWQIDAQVPQNVTPGNAVPLVVTAGGLSSNTVTIAVQ